MTILMSFVEWSQTHGGTTASPKLAGESSVESQLGERGAHCNLHRGLLFSREQYVQLAGFTSKKSQSVIGVPQGSILGPLLF